MCVVVLLKCCYDMLGKQMMNSNPRSERVVFAILRGIMKGF